MKQIAIPRMKKEIEESYASILAEFATKKPKKNSRDIQDEKEESDNRASFQRDRDRILHTKAFRRLMYKTQVFVNHEGDHFRTRLTHTLEVSQFARGMCKSLALNEDLAEAIALGHDLGHTPFGHVIERYIDKELQKRGMGNFFHNEQSVRVVDYLENREKGSVGLNLTYEVREGILKHNKDRSGIYKKLNPNLPCFSLEGQIVNIVDTIAYICHDLEDGIRSGIVERSMKRNDDIKDKINEMINLIEERTEVKIITDQFEETYFIRDLIHQFIMRLTGDCCKNIKSMGIKDLQDVHDAAKENRTIIKFSKENEKLFEDFKNYIYKYIYDTQTVLTMDSKAETLVENLFEAYENNPKLLPARWLYKYNHVDNCQEYDGAKHSEIRVIFDYISSMTDRFAIGERERLFNPAIKI